MPDLNAKLRELSLRPVVLRAAGLIPAEIYGKQFENKHIIISAKEFEKVFEEVGGNTVVNLKVGEEIYPVIVYDHQKDPITDKFISVDFFKVRLDEKITAPIPLEFIGTSSAVKELGGVLVKSMEEIEVEALPSDLPHKITVDVSAIKEIDGSIYVKDLLFAEGYEIIADPDTVIATVVLPEEEVAATPTSVEDIVTEGEIKRAESAKAEVEAEEI